MTSTIFSTGAATALTSGATRYTAISLADDDALSPTEAREQQLISSAGVIENLFAEVTTAPGTGETVTITLRLNGADTALTCTISGTGTTASDTTHTVTVAAGDSVCYKTVTSASSAAAGIRFSCQYIGDTANESQILGSAEGVSLTASTEYLPLSGCPATLVSTNVLARQLCPTVGTIKKFYVSLGTAPGIGSSRTFEIWKNDASTGVTITISGTSTTGNDTSNTISAGAGDFFCIKTTFSVAPAASTIKWGCTFTATTDTEFPVLAGTSADPSSSANRFAPVQLAGNEPFSTTETRFGCGQTLTVKNLYVAMSTAPASGKSWAVSVRNNGSDVLTATVANTATTGNASGTVSVADFDNLSIGVVPTGTPTAPSEFYWGINMSIGGGVTAFEPVVSWFL